MINWAWWVVIITIAAYLVQFTLSEPLPPGGCEHSECGTFCLYEDTE